eukprot:c24978_g1_i1.p1 GENE.c24978_g1_i1~~c24978_g1_i1.p1  ORF type:complete len:171 (-),score=62.68 c24978_g1_i1:12-524(-)
MGEKKKKRKKRKKREKKGKKMRPAVIRQPKIFYIHHYEEVFDPNNASGVRIVVKTTLLSLLKEEAATALNSTYPVKYLTLPSGELVTDVSNIPNQSHIYACVRSTKPNHPSVSGAQLSAFLKEKELQTNIDNQKKVPSSSSSSTVSYSELSKRQTTSPISPTKQTEPQNC